MRRWIVDVMERACGLTHPVVHRRPFLWLPFPVCPLATWSERLDERWGTGVWTMSEDAADLALLWDRMVNDDSGVRFSLDEVMADHAGQNVTPPA